MRLSSLALLPLLGALATTVNAATAEEDFASRCNAAGVVKCIGFDNTTADIVRGQNLHADGAGTYRAGLDTAQKTSGGGSLRFDLPPPPHAGGNIAGSWSPISNNALGRMFGQNSTFYVQFRQRLSPEMIDNTWNSSWKTALFHMNQQTCGGIELTTHNRGMTGLANMYSNCGSTHMYTKLDNSSYTESTPLLLQSGDYKCEYSKETSATCFYFVPNEWVTFYYKIHVGTWDRPESSIEAWIAREGSTTYKKFINVHNMPLSCNTDPCSQSPGSGQGYNNITFTPYMTSLSSNSGRAGVTARIWFDELVVSTQPIAAPGGQAAPRPNPPTDVRAN
jgi:hypothetical protein